MERNITVWLPLVPPTGDLAHNPGMCRDWESNWRPFGSQASSQSTEPYQPGQSLLFCRKGYQSSEIELAFPKSQDHAVAEPVSLPS